MKYKSTIASFAAIVTSALSINLAIAQTSHCDTYLTSGEAAYKQGQYAEAQNMFRNALAEAKKNCSLTDQSHSLTWLARTYLVRARDHEAKALYQRALTIDEKSLGAYAPAVIRDLLELASCCESMDRFVESESFLKRALARSASSKNPFVWPDRWSCDSDLADFYSRLGNYAEAEPLYKSVLADTEKRLGVSNPTVSEPMDRLAENYAKRGKFSEAEDLFKRAVVIGKSGWGRYGGAWGPMDKLASFYADRDRFDEAERVYKKCLAVLAKLDIPDGVTGFNKFLELEEATGALPKTAVTCGSARTKFERRFHNGNPVVVTLNGLAGVNQRQGKTQESEALYQFALAIAEKARDRGFDAVPVAIILNNLAGLYLDQGKYSEAEVCYRRSLEIKNHELNPTDPHVLVGQMNYAVLLAQINRTTEAQRLQATAKANDRYKMLASLGQSLNN